MVVLDEACSKSRDAPTDHGNSEDGVCAESFHSHDPGNFEDNVGRVEEGGYVAELIASESETFFEAECLCVA